MFQMWPKDVKFPAKLENNNTNAEDARHDWQWDWKLQVLAQEAQTDFFFHALTLPYLTESQAWLWPQ